MKAPFISPVLLEKYLLDQCNDQEKEEVEAWYAAIKGDADHLEKLSETEKSSIRESTFESIKGELNILDESPARPFPWRWISGIAASVAIAAGLYFNYPIRKEQPVSIIEEIQQKKKSDIVQFVNTESRIVTHMLPDSSSIIMHPEASVTYPARFDPDRRIVTFSGEGFFDITKDKTRPFLIQSGEMVIKVLGTSFNVKAASAQKVFQVDVMTGSVEVTAPGTETKPQQLVLKPKQQAIFEIESKRLTARQITIQPRKEIYEPVTVVFEEAPLNKVIEQLEKRFNVNIRLSNPATATCSVTANFESQPFTVILEMLCTTLEANYTISGNTILLNGTPCE
ncbi:FecR family protein [Dyadobacter chenhuakuii]|uniref:DUF4974 domain-containing protein n=1 Tax=Dyadobacter chenhuakuii TaxID=2909339 RepID=A0A9X1QB82_9BACT|nr:FecR domain-containing protein [Dyadobacter chenhuakuii]MCF2497976.1 DUF4974 domain-containing protein [Dyadobacter chenhuakuii]